jgi:hypothetical protein
MNPPKWQLSWNRSSSTASASVSRDVSAIGELTRHFQPAHSSLIDPPKLAYPCRASLARVQFWPPQNNPPNTQPSTRSTSAFFSEIFDA